LIQKIIVKHVIVVVCFKAINIIVAEIAIGFFILEIIARIASAMFSIQISICHLVAIAS